MKRVLEVSGQTASDAETGIIECQLPAELDTARWELLHQFFREWELSVEEHYLLYIR